MEFTPWIISDLSDCNFSNFIFKMRAVHRTTLDPLSDQDGHSLAGLYLVYIAKLGLQYAGFRGRIEELTGGKLAENWPSLSLGILLFVFGIRLAPLLTVRRNCH